MPAGMEWSEWSHSWLIAQKRRSYLVDMRLTPRVTTLKLSPTAECVIVGRQCCRPAAQETEPVFSQRHYPSQFIHTELLQAPSRILSPLLGFCGPLASTCNPSSPFVHM
jgi:hypothetical protein